MKVRAAVTFAGLISMRVGETVELAASQALSDLLRCGYVERVHEDIMSETEAVKGEAVGNNKAVRGDNKRRKRNSGC